jgi:superfamily II DNA or RNA helicase
LIKQYPKACATPVRLDGRGLGEIYGNIVEVVPMANLIADGHLVKPRVFASFTPNVKGVRTIKGNYDATQAAEIMNHKQISNIGKRRLWDEKTIDDVIEKLNSRPRKRLGFLPPRQVFFA